MKEGKSYGVDVYSFNVNTGLTIVRQNGISVSADYLGLELADLLFGGRPPHGPPPVTTWA